MLLRISGRMMVAEDRHGVLVVESQYGVEVDDEVLTVKSPSSLGSRSPTSTSVSAF